MGGDQAQLSPEQGAVTPVWLATLPDDGPTGGYFREQQSIPWEPVDVFCGTLLLPQPSKLIFNERNSGP